MNAVVDNDVLVKASSYGLLRPLIDDSIAGEPAFGYLAAARFIVPRKLNRIRSGNPAELLADLDRWFASAPAVETDDDEQELAATLEMEAQRLGLALDPGESQLCAVLTLRGVPLLFTGDKRAVEALVVLVDVVPRMVQLPGRVRCLEQLVRNALGRIPFERLRSAVCSEPTVDRSLAIAFACHSQSSTLESVCEGLLSYISDLRRKAPRILEED